ncbi:unnamed protein product [Coffea canephora]|uniref:DH200=94 genomic scaffold, scaffold_5555 n=1 Tax=Coffea canephora TaxID=49390 RepID=A0A068VLL3_COFCA|nr:unnamed protein product [Coffea canephora]
MAEDLAEILGKFALSSKELGGADLDRAEINLGVKECQLSLIGKIKGEKIVNYTGVKSFVTAAWSYPKDLRVVELGPNSFQFFIPGEQERERILGGGPSIIDSQILVLNRWREGSEEDERAFNEAPLWVQVWNLPVHWMSKDVGSKIGAVFNRVKEVIIPQTGSKEGRHIKLLVIADISQPLLRGTIVKMEGSTKWVSFKYECLTIIRLHCLLAVIMYVVLPMPSIFLAGSDTSSLFSESQSGWADVTKFLTGASA